MRNRIILLLALCAWSLGVRGQTYTISTIAGTPSSYGYSGDSGPATSALLSNTNNGTAIDSNGNIYVCDYGNRVIRKIAITGVITTIAGNGTTGFSGDGGPATSAQLTAPWGVAFDNNGNLYIADFTRVRKIDMSTGVINTIAGIGTSINNGDGGPATAASIVAYAIGIDSRNNIYLASNSINPIPGHLVGYTYTAIRKIDTAGIISNITDTVSGYSGDGGPATAAMVQGVLGFAFDQTDNIYFTDYLGRRIRKINSSGIINTIAGTGIYGFSGDGGAATSAQISAGNSILLDPVGNIFFTDRDNLRIRKIDTSGVISTITGNGTNGYSGDGGLATSAVIGPSYGMVMDNCGNIDFVDRYTIRKLTLSIDSIIGTTFMCAGSIATLTNATTGGTWASSNTAIASINSITGIVYAIAAGVVTITYTNNCGTSYATHNIAINALPNPGVILGTNFACVGTTTLYTDTLGDSGGMWSINNPSIATINSSGTLTCLAVGDVLMTYTVTNSCGTIYSTGPLLHVRDVPTGLSLTGSDSICVNSVGSFNVYTPYDTFDLYATPPSGAWSTSNASIASLFIVGPTSTQTHGVSSGVATITYKRANGCGLTTVTKTITVNPLPTITSAPISICFGSSGTLVASGGVTYTWSPGTGLSATTGTSIIASPTVTTIYTVTGKNINACTSRVPVTVTVTDVPSVAIITGASTTVCAGANITLANATTGGTWGSSNTAIATVSAGGLVHGVAAGAATISYSVTNSCGTTTVTQGITVNPLPNAGVISGIDTCQNRPQTLTSSGDAGGIWANTNITPIATINATTGVMTGNFLNNTAARNDSVTYTVTNGCGTAVARSVIKIKGNPNIHGTATMCLGYTQIFDGQPADMYGTGSFTYSNPAVCSVWTTSSTQGRMLATALSSSVGAVYTWAYNGSPDVCSGTVQSGPIIVSAPVVTITGPNTVIAGSTITLTGSVPGAWTNSNIAAVTIPTATATSILVTASTIIGSSATITLTRNVGCIVTDTQRITVVAGPKGIAPDDPLAEAEKNSFSVYPNPTSGVFTVTFPTGFDAVAISITNVSGKIIATKITEKNKVDFDLSQYPRGMYLIDVQAGDKKYRQKVLLQ